MKMNQTVRAAIMGLVIVGSTGACHQKFALYHNHKRPIVDRHLEVVSQGNVTLGSIKNESGLILTDDAIVATSANFAKLGSCVSVLKAANRIIISKSGKQSTMELLDGNGASLALLAADLGAKKFMVVSSATAFPVTMIEAIGESEKGSMVLEKLVFTCNDSVFDTVDQSQQQQQKDAKQIERRESLNIDLLVTLDAVKQEAQQEAKQEIQSPAQEVKAPTQQAQQEQKAAPAQQQQEQKPAPAQQQQR